MRLKAVRWCACAVLTAVTAAAMSVGSAQAEETVLWVGGTGGTVATYLPPDLFGTPDSFLGGAFRNHEFVVVGYPSALWPLTGPNDPTLGESVEMGTADLVAAAKSTPGPLVLAGVSQGAMVVQHAQAILADDPDFPSDTTFILIGDPNLGIASGSYGKHVHGFEYTPRPPAETRFTTLVVIDEYDGFADKITRPNALAILNAIASLYYVHPLAQNSDLAAVPAANVTTTINTKGGVTTTYLVPTVQLSVTMPLREIGVPDSLVDGIDAGLRTIIDCGYSRGSCTQAHAPWERPTHNPPRSRQATVANSQRATASARPRDSSSPPGAAGTSARRSPAR